MKRWLKIGIAILSLGFLPGCWDYQQINTRAAVLGIAIDPAPGGNPDSLHLTVQIPVFSTSHDVQMGSQRSGSSPQGYQTLSNTGSTIPEMMKRLQLQMDRNLDLAQLQIIVLNTRLSTDKVENTLSALMRDPRTNRLAYVASASSAAKILETQLSENTPAENLGHRFDSLAQHGYSVRTRLWQFWRDQTQYGVIPALPAVQIHSNEAGKPDAFLVSGLTAYPHSGGTLDVSKDEALSINLLKGHLKNMNMNIPMDHEEIALIEARDKSHLQCVVQGSHIYLKAHVAMRATLGQQTHENLQNMQVTDVTQVEKVVEKYETEEIEQTLRFLQQHSADVLGFGRLYLRNHPEDEKRVRQHWDQMFREAIPQVQVQVHLTSRGMLI